MTTAEQRERPRVLVVDDDESIRDVLHAALSDEGYDVRVAPDGGVALDVVGAWPPDAIVLDLRMPRVDGGAFCARYRERPPPRAPILLLTAARDASVEAARVGADASLDKPFDLDVLFARVHELVKPRAA